MCYYCLESTFDDIKIRVNNSKESIFIKSLYVKWDSVTMEMKKERDQKKSIQSMYIVIAVVSIFIILKILIGFLSNSTALLSDAVDSSTDLVVAISSIIGLKLVSRPPDKRFSYGYYKIENLITLGIAILIFIGSGTLVYEGIKSFFEVPSIQIPFYAMGVAIFSSITSLILYIYLKRVGQATSSPTILANAKDKITDSFRGIIILFGIICSYFKINYAEGIITILISSLAFKVGLEIATESILALLDYSDGKMQEKIEEVIKDTVGVENINRIRVRKTGAYYLGDAEIAIEGARDFECAHELADEIQQKIIESIPEVISFIVHVEPAIRNKLRIIFPINIEKNKDDINLDYPVYDHFGRAPHLLFISLDRQKKEIKETRIVDNPFVEKKQHAGLKLSKMLAKDEINTLFTKDIGEIAFYLLSGEHIDIFKADCATINECIEKLYLNEITKINEPTKENNRE